MKVVVLGIEGIPVSIPDRKLNVQICRCRDFLVTPSRCIAAKDNFEMLLIEQ